MPLKRTTRAGYAKARILRNNPSPAEKFLWNALKENRMEGIHFRRQHAIGPYIVDFCEVKKRLVVELDGSQHLDQQQYDNERTEFLNSWGYRVIRFWNNDVMKNINEVMQVIEDEIYRT